MAARSTNKIFSPRSSAPWELILTPNMNFPVFRPSIKSKNALNRFPKFWYEARENQNHSPADGRSRFDWLGRWCPPSRGVHGWANLRSYSRHGNSDAVCGGALELCVWLCPVAGRQYFDFQRIRRLPV